jgi:hypothetical protein
MSEDPKDFKVIDRRGSRDGESKEKEAKGESFTMKDTKEAPPSPTQIDFATLCLSLATGALMNLGVQPDPSSKTKPEKNLALAQQNIEILNLLKEKTKGNLSPDESQLLEHILTEVRLRFVEASRNG